LRETVKITAEKLKAAIQTELVDVVAELLREHREDVLPLITDEIMIAAASCGEDKIWQLFSDEIGGAAIKEELVAISRFCHAAQENGKWSRTYSTKGPRSSWIGRISEGRPLSA
jgi:hypothetical protein